MKPLTWNDWGLIYKAVTHARDTAFLTVGSKNHKAVRGWEELRKRIADHVEAAKQQEVG